LLKDPALESRARGLSAELRCLVCQNQSIDDSDAPLAKDLRTLIREQLMKARAMRRSWTSWWRATASIVLLKPRLTASTMLLWATPFAVLLIAGTALFLRERGRHQAPELPLTEMSAQALQKALE
jgi:cytochrome c-type biogenesis protein CcmH